MKGSDDLRDLSMLELFRVETENQTAVITSGLLELEQLAGTAAAPGSLLEGLMRAAHSLKGAARIVNLASAVRIAHAMEDCFVAAQHGKLTLNQPAIDLLFRGVDLFSQISQRDEAGVAAWEHDHHAELEQFLDSLQALMSGRPPPELAAVPPKPHDRRGKPAGSPKPARPKMSVAQPASKPAATSQRHAPPSAGAAPGAGKTDTGAAKTGAGHPTRDAGLPATPVGAKSPERVLRLTAESLNRLLGLAGESLVESRWLRPFADSMQRLKRMHSELEHTLDGLRQGLLNEKISERSAGQLETLFARASENRQFLAQRLEELDLFDRRSAQLSNRLYLEVLRTRMRPFSDGTQRFPRMVRDLARSLGKQARLEIVGENTQVDRDILERLETPLAHLLRNAVDHGCEPPEQRRRAGKPAEAVIRLEARHSAGMLLVEVSDDGAGLDLQRLGRTIVAKQLAPPTMVEKMSEAELLEFLFLPGFTMKSKVTEISGRGVGLDIVQNLVKSLRGSVRVFTEPGRGMKFQLHLPLTLSVLRTLLVEIGGEPYAVPLAQIIHTLKLSRERIEVLEGRQHFHFGGRQIGLLSAHEVLATGRPAFPHDHATLSIVVLGDRAARYGLVVDRFLGERELVVQPLDPRLGKVKDISAAALMEDGTPALILDVEEIVHSIERLIAEGTLARVAERDARVPKRKRILAVDDSLTVRELERKLLASRGYLADVAVDGMEAWNAVRTGQYDLVITDVDMPRMDGIELATLIKKDAQLKSLPVLIVSYKDRPEDRLRGLNAGADYYLTKGSFHDERLLEVVLDLIGEPEA
jgi:two-component system sensor histidine kinase and response regulator WspE